MADTQEQILARVRVQAFQSLSAQKRQTTNLHIDSRIYQKGERLGPEFQNIVVAKPSVLVFADDHPLANFGHDCRYLLYDAASGNPIDEIPARFPPYLQKPPATLKIFHEPVRIEPNLNLFRVWPILRCPIFVPDGNRYAILYSGMSNMRHLNDLEFCYRMLIDRYAFDPKQIYVLNYDGTMNTQDGAPGLWPGDNTAYRIKVTAKGDKASFEAAFNDLKTKLKPADLLFIHTNNHGDNYSDGKGSFLCAYPSWGTYYATDFCNDLKALPKYRSLLVMMEQCNSGGFNAPVVAASTAGATSIASAADASHSSWASPDGNWDSFARDWIAAEIGHGPNGGALVFNPDTDMDGAIEAEEAFGYASNSSVKNPSDSPVYDENSEAGGDITLNQQYELWWWWCWIVLPVLQKYYPTFPPNPPDPEFYDKVARITPALQKLLTPAFDKAAADLRREMAPKVEAAVQAAFTAK
jgi:hypothetical protein